MDTGESLFGLFGLLPDCTDDELRKAFHQAMLKYHPDMNPDNVEAATVNTQKLTAAYKTLKDHRKQGDAFEYIESDLETSISLDNISFTVTFSGVDIKDIARRKKSFYQAWINFNQNKTNTFIALQFIHAAFEAERQDYVNELLINPILIDASSLLLHLLNNEVACETLLQWAEILYLDHQWKDAIQILEDVLSTGDATERVVEELRKMHYYVAQGYAMVNSQKPAPEVRIKHLLRIIEIGFKYDYIYKHLAEAYHDLGDDEQARSYLRRAYKINPQLSGSKRITRALGLSSEESIVFAMNKKCAIYKYTRPEHIPQPSQIREWAANSNWNAILAFVDISNYSPHIIPGSRSTIRQIAQSLGTCDDQKSQDALINLLDSVYWDVREACILSLAKVGNLHTLHFFQNYTPRNTTDAVTLGKAIQYLQIRLDNQLTITTANTNEDLFTQAKLAFNEENYSQARFLLECIKSNIYKDDLIYQEVFVLLAQSCGKMQDQESALSLITPIFNDLPLKIRHEISGQLASWIWNQYAFANYDSINDSDYQLAIEIHFSNALISNDPDDVLRNIKSLTRWMEILGEGEIAQWLRNLIRTKAPGTWYVDSHDRVNYIRDVDLSKNFQLIFKNYFTRMKNDLPKKLNQVLQISDALLDSRESPLIENTES